MKILLESEKRLKEKGFFPILLKRLEMHACQNAHRSSPWVVNGTSIKTGKWQKKGPQIEVENDGRAVQIAASSGCEPPTECRLWWENWEEAVRTFLCWEVPWWVRSRSISSPIPLTTKHPYLPGPHCCCPSMLFSTSLVFNCSAGSVCSIIKVL